MSEDNKLARVPGRLVRRFDRGLQKLIRHLPLSSAKWLYSVCSRYMPGLVGFRFLDDKTDIEVVSQAGREIFFPKPIPRIKLSHLALGYAAILYRKYNAPGFVEVQEGDVVVDCGGFVGGFSLSASALASKVYIFEPSPENAKCIRLNFRAVPLVEVHEMGLSNKSCTLPFNLSPNAVEHSFLQPDDGCVESVLEVPVVRLDTFFEERAVPDFVKIEAEGLEPEILSGLGELRPAKIAVDVSPERNGQSPKEEISEKLTRWGYQTIQCGHVLFARLSGS